MKFLLYGIWATWVFWCAVALGLAVRFAGFHPFTRNYLLHLGFILFSFIPLELFAFGLVVERNPLLRVIRKADLPALREFYVDLIAFIGFGCFSLIGMIATATSRNAFYYVADTVVGLLFLVIYGLRRENVLNAIEVPLPINIWQ